MGALAALFAGLCSASAFPAMLLTERWRPIKPDPALIAWQKGRGWYHNFKNRTTEAFRADAQWWSKCMCFCLAAALLAVLGLIMLWSRPI